MTTNAAHESDAEARTPRWVWVQGLFVVALILLVLAMSAGLLHGDSAGFAHGGH